MSLHVVVEAAGRDLQLARFAFSVGTAADAGSSVRKRRVTSDADPRLVELARYDFRGKTEQDVREEWITPLLVRLGYGPSTLHQVRRSETVRLRVPLRMLGSKRYQLDYRPTVHGHGLWIIEAKAPEGVDPQLHLAQAWTYATHPDVNVPLFVLADGRRLSVHDVNSTKWDEPILEVQAAELPLRFDELLAVLSPRAVARVARRRLVDHLERVLRSEIDYDALDAAVKEVRGAADRARVAVSTNRQTIVQRAARQRETQDEQILMSARLWGLAQELNIPIGWSRNDVERAIRVLAVTPETVGRDLEQMFAAVRGSAGEDRAFWGLRTYRLAAAGAAQRRFESLPEPGWVRPAIRDYLLGFPDDATSAAAHRLELPLFVWAVRRLTQPRDSARSRFHEWLTGLGEEVRLSLGPFTHPHSMVLNAALLTCRMFWANIKPWDEVTLLRARDDVVDELDSIEYDPTFLREYVGLSLAEHWEAEDPLVDYTIIAAAEWHEGIRLSAEEAAVVHARVGGPGSVGAAAQRLLG